jgi:hypothetical protein
MTEHAYKPTPRKVVHETIDGEVILIQLERGVYFSLGGTGAEIWDLLARGFGTAAISAAIARRYASEADAVAAAVAGLVEQLVAEDVLVADGDAGGGEIQLEPAEGEFEAPALERYDDMQDFLLIDPVHEVAESGWPQRDPGA